MRDDTFIWTEIYRCGKIANILLKSYLKHETEPIHVFGTPTDFSDIPSDSRIILHDLSQRPDILNGFNSGHLGTAKLWADLILNRSEKWLIHIDSDVIVRKPCLIDLFTEIDAGYDLVGPIRNYKHNPNNRDDVRHLPDLSQTLFFAFNREKAVGLNGQRLDVNTLTNMCRGTHNPYGESVIDFFDPVMFLILRNGGRVAHLNNVDYGGCDYYGKRITNGFPTENMILDFGTKLIHFSAVGSGMNFFHNMHRIDVPIGYVQYAIEKYAIFCELFYNEKIPFRYDRNKYNSLFNLKEWY